MPKKLIERKSINLNVIKWKFIKRKHISLNYANMNLPLIGNKSFLMKSKAVEKRQVIRCAKGKQT